jgi:hypothetical protein
MRRRLHASNQVASPPQKSAAGEPTRGSVPAGTTPRKADGRQRSTRITTLHTPHRPRAPRTISVGGLNSLAPDGCNGSKGGALRPPQSPPGGARRIPYVRHTVRAARESPFHQRGGPSIGRCETTEGGATPHAFDKRVRVSRRTCTVTRRWWRRPHGRRLRRCACHAASAGCRGGAISGHEPQLVASKPPRAHDPASAAAWRPAAPAMGGGSLEPKRACARHMQPDQPQKPVPSQSRAAPPWPGAAPSALPPIGDCAVCAGAALKPTLKLTRPNATPLNCKRNDASKQATPQPHAMQSTIRPYRARAPPRRSPASAGACRS